MLRKRRPSKRLPSKLDPYTEQLDQWFGKELRQLKWVQRELEALGCHVALGTISNWWQNRREAMYNDRVLSQITGGANLSEALKERFEKHGAPQLDVMIKLHQVLIQDLQANENINPHMLKQADNMMRTVMDFEATRLRVELDRQKIALRERSVIIQEKKVAAFDRAQEILQSSEGVITQETIKKIEQELRLL
jgi:hypothetical protein